MTMVRDVTVGFQGAGKKIESVHATIPADWVTGENDALSEIEDNPKVRSRIAVALGTAVYAKIGDPYDDSPQAYATVRSFR